MAFYGEPQWAVVGDTFIVGCVWSDNIVYRNDSFEGNPDGENPKYKYVELTDIEICVFVFMKMFFLYHSTKYGMYKPNCGLKNVMMSWGHDEYMYRVLKHNKSTLPDVACNIIKYHSFYPWHSSGDYEYLAAPEDEETKKWVLIFKYV